MVLVGEIYGVAPGCRAGTESQGAIFFSVLQIDIAFGSRIRFNILIARMKDKKAESSAKS